MRYYLIAGEASGDLHASHLMTALKRRDANAQFRFIGGDQMAAAGGTMVRHYRELAYMGFVPVLIHLPTILRNMRMAKRDIGEWHPDCVILVDYPGFNLAIAKYVHAHLSSTKVYYYISPKIWAWKEYRIKNIRRDVDELFSILPFEVEFFEQKHHYPIHYVGNPTYEEVRQFKEENDTPAPKKPVIALLPGSRRQEIRDNLPSMIEAAKKVAQEQYQLAIAASPGIEADYYRTYADDVPLVFGNTYSLLSTAHAALVTSGTATLETALFGVPQVVCYATALPHLFGWLKRNFLKVKYVSLVNLIVGREVVPELVADGFTTDNIVRHLEAVMQGEARSEMLRGYDLLRQRLKPQQTSGDMGTQECGAAENTARIIINKLNQ